MILPEIGAEGQAALARAHAAVIGVGALGCQVADMLARAGVGRLTLVDRDLVDRTNLQRQTLFTEVDAAERLPKAAAAEARLRAVNSEIQIEGIAADVTSANAARLFAEAPTVFVDGTDNFETRYLINDLAVKLGVPMVYGGVIAGRGMAATFVPGGACLRCVFPEAPAAGSQPTCDTAGVFGPAVAVVGACEAADALKICAGRADLLSGTLLSFDLFTNERRRVDLSRSRDAQCPCCGARRFEFLEGGEREASSSLCGQNAVQVSPAAAVTVDLAALAARLAPHSAVRQNRFMVRAAFNESALAGLEITVFSDGRAIVHGTERAEVARSVYARFVGG